MMDILRLCFPTQTLSVRDKLITVGNGMSTHHLHSPLINHARWVMFVVAGADKR